MSVVVVLPRLLEPAVGPRQRIEVEGSTVDEVLSELFTTAPQLRVHLLDGNGSLRPHVHCFVDGVGTRLEDPAAPVPDGAEVVFLQAVSGG